MWLPWWRVMPFECDQGRRKHAITAYMEDRCRHDLTTPTATPYVGNAQAPHALTRLGL